MKKALLLLAVIPAVFAKPPVHTVVLCNYSMPHVPIEIMASTSPIQISSNGIPAPLASLIPLAYTAKPGQTIKITFSQKYENGNVEILVYPYMIFYVKQGDNIYPIWSIAKEIDVTCTSPESKKSFSVTQSSCQGICTNPTYIVQTLRGLGCITGGIDNINFPVIRGATYFDGPSFGVRLKPGQEYTCSIYIKLKRSLYYNNKWLYGSSVVFEVVSVPALANGPISLFCDQVKSASVSIDISRPSITMSPITLSVLVYGGLAAAIAAAILLLKK